MSRVGITNVSATIPSGLLIGGKWVKGNGEKLDSVNPDTEEVIATVRRPAAPGPPDRSTPPKLTCRSRQPQRKMSILR